MPGRASIVGAAATHVGKVREHNEDAHFFDADAGLFVVCDGMGGHAAGEVASGIAIRVLRQRWSADDVQHAIDRWLETGTPEAKKAMLATIREAARSAHDTIIAEAAQDEEKAGMGTTLVGAIAVGNELVFAHAGDSRAYIVRDNIAMQLTEDHTLLSRLLAAGIEVDVSGEGARFRSMLTNALGIGQECKISTFVVPLADGDRFLLCSDGISEYVPEPEIGKVLTSAPSPARAAQKLIDLALERGGADNATAMVIRVLEAGETPQPVELRRKDDAAIQSCALWDKVSPQQRLRALRIALGRDVAANERLPAHTLGERVAWIIIDGTVEHGDKQLGPGALLYPESLIKDSQPPDRDSLAITRSDVRALILRADDFFELCEDDPELAELLHETLGKLVKKRGGLATHPGIEEDIGRMPTLDPDTPRQTDRKRSRAETSELIEPPPPVAPPLPITIPDDAKDAVPTLQAKQPSGPRPIPKLQIPSVVNPASATPKGGVGPQVPATPPPTTGPSKLPSWAMATTPAEPPKPAAPATKTPVTETQPLPLATRLPATPAPKPHAMIGAKSVAIPSPAKKVVAVAPARPVASSLDQLRIPTPPGGMQRAAAASAVPKLVVSEQSPAQIDLGSELRADLGGEHAVPKKRPSAPKIETRAPTPEPGTDEPEIEEVVELEADAPPDEDDDSVEMTVVEGDGDEPTLSTSPAIDPDDGEAEMTITVAEDVPEEAPKHRPITPTESVVVSGTIKIPEDEAHKPGRSKRLSDGWEE